MTTQSPEAPRLAEARRDQLELRSFDLESLVAEDHPVRSVWALVERLDLSKFKEGIKARGERAGRPAIDPKILVSLWVQGCLDGIGSARELARRCVTDNGYRWICGGVEVSHHTLSDFRVEHPEAVDELLTQIIASMTNNGLIDLSRVAQDGTRVRASAGASSFRRRKSLEDCYEQAKSLVEELKKEADEPDAQIGARRKAARERATRERLERVKAAVDELPKLEAIKEKNLGKNTQRRSEPRVSTTDPAARVMKMANGGFQPGMNVQLAAETKGRVIVGVQVTNAGSDAALAIPMIEQEIVRRTGETPKEYLIDGGFTTREAVQAISDKGITVYGGLKKPKNPEHDPHEPKPEDTPAYAELRLRMKTPEAKRIYTERGALIETINADLREHRDLRAFLVRGLAKTRTVAIWLAIAYNLMRWISLTRGRPLA
jgi:transposase